MRQSGILAAAGLVALDTMLPRLAEDHAHARLLADAMTGQDAVQTAEAFHAANGLLKRDTKRNASGDSGKRVGDIVPAGDNQRHGADFAQRVEREAASKWKVTLVVWGAVIAVGLIAYGGGLAREGFPPVNLPIVVVDSRLIGMPTSASARIGLPPIA